MYIMMINKIVNSIFRYLINGFVRWRPNFYLRSSISNFQLLNGYIKEKVMKKNLITGLNLLNYFTF